MQANENIIYLQDSNCYKKFYPFTHTIHTGQLLSGMYTMQQRWEAIMGCKVVCIRDETAIDCVTVFSADEYPKNYHLPILNNCYDIVGLNTKVIDLDASKIKMVPSHALPPNVKIMGTNAIHIGHNVQADFCIFNTTEGPIIIEDDVLIMEGSLLRGPLVIKKKAVVKAGARIYGGTTIGKKCIVGGEIKNSILLYAANKAHDGYLGDSYIGAWCNMGAGTSNSNVKNTGGIIHFFSEFLGESIPISNKAGVLMGHYTKTAINSSLNSGTVIGNCCNVFGDGLTPKYIDHFNWGFNEFTVYKYDEAIQHINNWMGFKKETLSEETEIQLRKLYKKMIKPIE
jgi:UDP-N-acetylglucosamine diphosphorylase/glucosamine-1-phosphate N-acetyltransferase